MTGVRLIIVDDDPGIREALRSLVEDLGAHVLAEADNGHSAIEQAERHHPQLILLDVSMPVMGGLPAARYLREHIPDLRIILVSQHNQKVYADEALHIGARGYIVKAAAATELGPAIKIVMDGGTFVSPRLV
jgi:DNA-binding NarL/FixJ family response regulator